MRRARTLAALPVLACAGAVAVSLFVPYQGFRGESFVDIPRGTGSRSVARLLSDAGVVRYRWQFLAVRALRPRARLHAGEYCFRAADSPWKVFDRLVRGDVFYRPLTVPEGQNMFDIAASLDQIGIIGSGPFLQAARDPSIIRDLAPEARTLEGYLFPDTYRITRHTTAAQLCAEMTARFRRAWAEAGGSGPVHPAVTLASLVEKETARAEERPLVASVFKNRLAIGVPLDCDPTAIYAAMLEGRYRGEISRSDLESKSPYNTYQTAGLPPGPIANPGLEALKAALHPAQTRYLYFVARPDGSGAHVFSEHLEEHQRAVSRYRRGNQKAIQARAAEPASRGKAGRSSH
jgi:UPF0755 protein